MKILLVEDETLLAEAITQILTENGFSVDVASDGEDGLDAILSGIYDIAIFDIMLPKIDGLTILKKARERGIEIPILILSAKGDVEDRVSGLTNGADDYLGKPFRYEELIARLKALGRRRKEYQMDDLLRFEELEFNPYTLELKRRHLNVKLTRKEAQIFEMLLVNYPRLSTKERMIEKVWGYDSDAEYNNVEMQISLLRRKIRQTQSQIEIKVIRGMGYMLNDPTSETS